MPIAGAISLAVSDETLVSPDNSADTMVGLSVSLFWPTLTNADEMLDESGPGHAQRCRSRGTAGIRSGVN